MRRREIERNCFRGNKEERERDKKLLISRERVSKYNVERQVKKEKEFMMELEKGIDCRKRKRKRGRKKERERER